MKRIGIALCILFAIIGVAWVLRANFFASQETHISDSKTDNAQNMNINGIIQDTEPLSIDALRNIELDNSAITIEDTLPAGGNYKRYVASYTSEGHTIYGLLTIPNSSEDSNEKFPVVIFNHGFIPPLEYRTTERYVAYQDAFARNGYVTFKSDYRGHGSSEGDAAGGYGSNAYTIDVLNALEAVKKMDEVDPNRIGMWGHSMGGFITLRAMVVRDDIKAGVIWGGVVASYPDLINNWRRRLPSPQPLPSGARRWRDVLVQRYGEPSDSDPFWRSLSANSYLAQISGPLQLHHSTLDESVPYVFSQKLEEQMKAAHKEVELYLYEGDDHDISANFNTAIERSVEFFDKNVK